jgi:hypothetical protein
VNQETLACAKDVPAEALWSTVVGVEDSGKNRLKTSFFAVTGKPCFRNATNWLQKMRHFLEFKWVIHA